MSSRLQRINPDNSESRKIRKMTDTEMIQNWIENGESVLLLGPSGIGKTYRLRELYPNIIELKLTNNMFPEKVVGSTNIQTGEEIPPNYAKQIILQSASKDEKKDIEENIQKIYEIADEIYRRSNESDDKIPVLLDELLNVKPHIQSLVYTLVLNRFVEIGGGIKLPKNVVVVATGNQKKYSSASNDLAKPLEKRFDHILDMEPKVGEWLIEFAIPKKLHPSIISYIAHNYEQRGCSENISNMEYFYEEDEDIGNEEVKDRTNDPRGWEAISNIVTHFEENLKNGKYSGMDVEDIFRRSVGTKLSSYWTEDFFEFYNNLPILTPEQIVNGYGKEGGYSKLDIPNNENDKYLCSLLLLTANEEQVECCRKFLVENCSRDDVEIFDKYWPGNDKTRIEMIDKFQKAQGKGKLDAGDFKQYAGKGIKAFFSIGKDYNRDINGVSNLVREDREDDDK